MDPLSPVSTQFAAQTSVTDALASRATNAASNAKSDKVKGAAQQFEAFFVGQMMEYMSEGIKSDDVFGGGHAEQTWRTMLNQEYGKQVAKSGRLGITDTVMKSMLESQEKRTAALSAQEQPAAGDSPVASTNVTPDVAAAALAGSVARSKSITA
jgi:flagellar protein FlgJ